MSKIQPINRRKAIKVSGYNGYRGFLSLKKILEGKGVKLKIAGRSKNTASYYLEGNLYTNNGLWMIQIRLSSHSKSFDKGWGDSTAETLWIEEEYRFEADIQSSKYFNLTKQLLNELL